MPMSSFKFVILYEPLAMRFDAVLASLADAMRGCCR